MTPAGALQPMDPRMRFRHRGGAVARMCHGARYPEICLVRRGSAQARRAVDEHGYDRFYYVEAKVPADARRITLAGQGEKWLSRRSTSWPWTRCGRRRSGSTRKWQAIARDLARLLRQTPRRPTCGSRTTRSTKPSMRATRPGTGVTSTRWERPSGRRTDGTVRGKRCRSDQRARLDSARWPRRHRAIALRVKRATANAMRFGLDGHSVAPVSEADKLVAAIRLLEAAIRKAPADLRVKTAPLLEKARTVANPTRFARDGRPVLSLKARGQR